MIPAKEKAAWVLETPETASNQQCTPSLPAVENIGNGEPLDYPTLKSLFKSRGYRLNRAHGLTDGSTTYLLTRWETPIAFKSLSDVQAYLGIVTDSMR